MSKFKMPKSVTFSGESVSGRIYSHGYSGSQIHEYARTRVNEALEAAARRIEENAEACNPDTADALRLKAAMVRTMKDES